MRPLRGIGLHCGLLALGAWGAAQPGASGASTAASLPGAVRNGDLMLCGSRTLVVVSQTFDSSYPYTRVGRVDDPAGSARALGKGSVRIGFSR